MQQWDLEAVLGCDLGGREGGDILADSCYLSHYLGSIV